MADTGPENQSDQEAEQEEQQVLHTEVPKQERAAPHASSPQEAIELQQKAEQLQENRYKQVLGRLGGGQLSDGRIDEPSVQDGLQKLRAEGDRKTVEGILHGKEVSTEANNKRDFFKAYLGRLERAGDDPVRGDAALSAFSREILQPMLTTRGIKLSEEDEYNVTAFLNKVSSGNLDNKAKMDAMKELNEKVDLKRIMENVRNAGSQEMLDMYYPHDILSVFKSIMDFYGPLYQEGGEYELIDKDGNPVIENFFRWIRQQGVEQSGLNPDGNAELLSRIYVPRAYGQTSIIDLYLMDRYWNIPSENGELRPMKDYKQIKDDMLNEVWLFDTSHGGDAEYRKANATGQIDKMVEFMQGLTSRGIYTKNNERIQGQFKMTGIDGRSVGDAYRMASALYMRLAFLEEVGGKTVPSSENKFLQRLRQGDRIERNGKVYYENGNGAVNGDVEDVFFQSLVSNLLVTQLGSIQDEELKKLFDYKDVFSGRSSKSGDRLPTFHEILFTKDAKKRQEMISTYHDKIVRKFAETYNDDPNNIPVTPLDVQFLIENKNNPSLFRDKLRLREFDAKATELIRSLSQVDAVPTIKTILGQKYWHSGELRVIDEEIERMNAGGKKDSALSLDLVTLLAYKSGNTRGEAAAAIDNWFEDSKHKGLTDSTAFMKDLGIREKGLKALNMFNTNNPANSTLSALRAAIRDAVGVAYALDVNDAKYAEHRASKEIRILGASGINDTTATGWDLMTKLFWLGAYRYKQLVGTGFAGCVNSISEDKRAMGSFWETIHGTYRDRDGKLKDGTLLNLLEAPSDIQEATDADLMSRGVSVSVLSKTEKIQLKRQYGKIKHGGIHDMDIDAGLEIVMSGNVIPNALNMYNRAMSPDKNPIVTLLGTFKSKLGMVNDESGGKGISYIKNGWLKALGYQYDSVGMDWEALGLGMDFEFRVTNAVEGSAEVKAVYNPVVKGTTKRQSVFENFFGGTIRDMRMYEEPYLKKRGFKVVEAGGKVIAKKRLAVARDVWAGEYACYIRSATSDKTHDGTPHVHPDQVRLLSEIPQTLDMNMNLVRTNDHGKENPWIPGISRTALRRGELLEKGKIKDPLTRVKIASAIAAEDVYGWIARNVFKWESKDVQALNHFMSQKQVDRILGKAGQKKSRRGLFFLFGLLFGIFLKTTNESRKELEKYLK